MAIVLEDQSGNGNTLTNNGAVEVSSSLPFAQSTTAVDLESTESDYLYAADSASLSFTGDFTIECWVKFETVPSVLGANVFLVAKDDASDRSFAMMVVTDDKLRLNFYDGAGNNTRINSDAAVATGTGTWMHLAAAVDVSVPSAAMYKDGSLIASTVALSAATAVKNSATDVVIGALSNKTEGFFDGVMDEVRIFDDIRTGTEIGDNYNVEISTGNNLQAYWPFETVGAPPASAAFLGYKTLTGVGL